MTKIINNRLQLLAFIRDHLVYKHIKRAMDEGEVENYGGFSDQRWIVRVTTIRGKDYFACVRVIGKEYKLSMIKHVPWREWCGGGFRNELYNGDSPKMYMELREQCLNQS